MLNSLLQRLMDWVKTAAGVTVLTALVALFFGTWDRGPYLLVNTIVSGGMLGLVAMGLAIIFGVMNIPQFAHGEFFMVGGLAAYYVMTPILPYTQANPGAFLAFLAPFLAILAATAAGAVTGAITEKFCIRPLRKRTQRNWVMNSFLLTVGIAVVMVNGHQLLFGTEFKGITRFWQGRPLEIMEVFVSIDRFMALILATVVIVGFWFFMKYSRTGRAIRAVSQDETGARMVGINLDAISSLTFSLGCAMAAVAGGCLLFMYPSYPTVGLEPLYMAWFVVILVGLGNVLGALIGGFMVALLKELTMAYVGAGWEFVVPSAIIILVLIFKPSGIFGTEVRGVLDE